MHRDGYGFVIPDRPIEGIKGDIYIPATSARRAMHGDRVLIRIARIERDGRADGEILKVLARAHPTVVGEFRIRQRGSFVVPHARVVQHDHVGRSTILAFVVVRRRANLCNDAGIGAQLGHKRSHTRTTRVAAKRELTRY